MTGGLAHNLWAAAELLAGFGIVMATLTLLWGLTAAMSRLFAALQRPPAAAATATAALAPAAADQAADDEEIAVVAAAVALMLGAPHRVLRVLPQPSAWGQEGRRDTHASHRMPR